MSNKLISAFENGSVDVKELNDQQLFRQVELTALQSLLHDCPSLTLREGTPLIEPGQVNHLIYLVLGGCLHVCENESATEPLAVVQPGECVGLMSMMDQQPCHVLVVAKEKTRLLVLDEERFLALVNSSEAIARNALLMTMQYLRIKNVSAPERGRVQRRIENSNIDPVTGLYNQRWLDGVLERQILRAATDRKPLSVLAICFEDYSEIKRELGNDAANFTLATVAQMISANIRPTDMIARHNIDHFLVVLPETDEAAAELVEARIRRAAAKAKIEIPDICDLPPLNLATGKVQMKAFVAARKLVEDAVHSVVYAKQRTKDSVAV